MRRASLTVAVLLAMLTAGSGLLAQTAGTSTIIQRVLVKVNGQIFTQKDLEDKQVEALQAMGKADVSQDELSKTLAGLMPDVIVSAIDEMLLLQRGKELGYHLSDAQFKDTLDGIKKDRGWTDAQFKQALGEEGLTLDGLRDRIDRRFTIDTIKQQEVIRRMPITTEEAHQYYDKHPDDFMKPPSVTLREIFIAVAAAPAATTSRGLFSAPASSAGADDAARQKIIAIRERIEKGEAFETLVTEASEAASKSTGGLVTIDLADLSPVIKDAIDALQPGQVTQPIHNTQGYRLFKLESRTVSKRLPFDTVLDEVTQKIGETRLPVEVQKYLRLLRGQAVLDWKRDDLKKIYEQKLADQAKQPLPPPTE